MHNQPDNRDARMPMHIGDDWSNVRNVCRANTANLSNGLHYNSDRLDTAACNTWRRDIHVV